MRASALVALTVACGAVGPAYGISLRATNDTNDLITVADGTIIADANDTTGDHEYKLDDHCSCLNWKDAYTEHGAECGKGFEYSRLMEQLGGQYPKYAQDFLQVLGDHVNQAVQEWDSDSYSNQNCKGGYEMINDNVCARIVMGLNDDTYKGKSWCYVSAACELGQANTHPTGTSELGLTNYTEQFDHVISSTQLGVGVHVKLCEKGKDTLLADKDPEELIAWGQKQGITVPGFLVKLAYPFDDRWDFTNAEQHKAEIDDDNTIGEYIVMEQKRHVMNPPSDVRLPLTETSGKLIMHKERVWAVEKDYEQFKCAFDC